MKLELGSPIYCTIYFSLSSRLLLFRCQWRPKPNAPDSCCQFGAPLLVEMGGEYQIY